MIMIIVSDKYTKNKEGAQEDLNEVIDEEDQVEAILDWLENVLPGVVLDLSGGKSNANQKPEAKEPVKNVKATRRKPITQKQTVPPPQEPPRATQPQVIHTTFR